jgi:hypothetical protein
MGINTIGTGSNNFAIDLFEFLDAVTECNQLSGADESEVRWVEEENLQSKPSKPSINQALTLTTNQESINQSIKHSL